MGKQGNTETIFEILRGYQRDSSCLFGTTEETLITDGVFACIDSPSHGAHASESELQREIQRQFRLARVAGIENPLVVGSMPFDTRSPSRLFIPERHRFVSQSYSAKRVGLVDSDVASSQGRFAFEKAVRSVLELVREGSVEKVVVSRALNVELSSPFDMGALLTRLLAGFPTGYRFAIPTAQNGTLVGVSPELLIRRQGSKLFSNPLAGSLPAGSDDSASALRLQHSEKDLREHRVVAQQVGDALRPYCRELSLPSSPSLLRTAFLWHLSTWIEGILLEPGANALALASALHPTPAVCGHPREKAAEAIRHVESHDRGLFTGMTGWMNARGDGAWVVTLRCAEVRASDATLYAGAGIVEGSDPELEWRETTAKMAAMQALLGRGRESSAFVAEAQT